MERQEKSVSRSPELRRSSTGLEDLYSENCKKLIGLNSRIMQNQMAEASQTRKRRATDDFSRTHQTKQLRLKLRSRNSSRSKLWLNVAVTDIEVRKPLHSFGIDSIVSLKIRYWISKEIKAEVGIFDILQASGLAGWW